MSAENKNTDYVARGLKATLHNENTSTAAKESAAQRLQEMGAEVPQDFKGSKKDAKQSASTTTRGTQAQLTRDDDADYESEGPEERVTENEGLALGETNRVIGGYKATLKNPHVSEGAKKHAEDVLRETYS